MTPKNKPLRLNPGTIPEAAALEKLTYEVAELRAVVVRESAGVDSPARKLGAIDQVVRRHSDSISRAMRAARSRHGGALAPDDALRLVYSIFTNVTLQVDWLQTAAVFKRIPSGPPSNRELSVAKTRKAREDRLGSVKGRTAVAIELIEDLERVALIDPGMRDTAGAIALLASLRIQLRCNEINAVMLVSDNGRGRRNLSDIQLRLFREELQGMATSEQFAHRNDSAQSAVWQSLAIVCSYIGDNAGVTEALTNRRKVVGASIEEQIGATSAALRMSSSSIERLSLVIDLEDLEDQGKLGPIFSRRRIGLISILGDSLAALASRASDDEAGRALFDACIRCQERWMFGADVPPDFPVIRVVASWHGEGRVTWRLGDETRFRDFQLEPTIVGEFIVSRETMSSNASIWRRMLDQTQIVGPAISEALADLPGARFQTIGLASHLPLSALQIGEAAIGTRETFGYVHPLAGRPRISGSSMGWTPDLVVVDQAFREDARMVTNSARAAGVRSVLAFNSAEPRNGLERRELLAALADSSGVLLFGHGLSKFNMSAETGLLIGDNDVFNVQDLADLDLRNVNDLALIACSSGRGNPFVGNVTVAHAAALAGVRNIGFTYWPINQSHGASVASRFLREAGSQRTLGTFIAGTVSPTDPGNAAFSIILE